MRLVPNSWGSPKQLREYNKCHDAKGKFCSTGGLADEEGDTEPPEVGQPFIVYRLGSGPTGLDNKNAGNAVGVAEHLANIEDPEKPAMLGGYGDTISAYIVRVRRPFTSYSGFKNQNRNFDYGLSKPEGNTVGRVVIGGAVVNYSFPKGGEWTATHLASIPLKDIKKKLSYPSFDYVGTAAGARAIRKAFAPFIQKAQRKKTRKVREFNRCHKPSGPGGGQFAAKGACGLSAYGHLEPSEPVPGYLHSDVLMARKAGIATIIAQQPEPVRDVAGVIHDPLALSHFERGEMHFRDKQGHSYVLPVGRIGLTIRGGKYDPFRIIYDSFFNQRREQKELTPEDLPPDQRMDREDVLSTFRHEVGHAVKGRDAIDTPALIVAGQKVTSDMAQEMAAWQFAVAISPAHRVSARIVRKGLASHAYTMYHAEKVSQEDWFKNHVPRYDQPEYLDRRLRSDPVDPDLKAKADAFAERATKVILRYGRRLRKRGIQFLPPTRPAPWFDKTKRVQPGPGGVGI